MTIWYPTDDAGRLMLAYELAAAGFKATQPKQAFDRDKIEKMADAMSNNGFDWHSASLQPVILGANGEIMGGHHRVVAAQLAGIDLTTIVGPHPQIRILPFNFPIARLVSDWIDVLPDV